jgi:hypothetical protein
MRKSFVAFTAFSLFIIISTGSIQAQNFNGPVGIGTSAPNTFVEIKKIVPGGLGPILRLTGGGEVGGQCALDLATFDAGGNAPAFRMIATDVGNYTARVDFQIKTPGNIGNGLVNQMSLTEYGNLGIGTSNPAARLHVEGNGFINGDLTVGQLDHNPGLKYKLDFGGNSNSDPMWLARTNVSGDASELRMSISDDGGAADRFVVGYTPFNTNVFTPLMHVNANGVVGIGTTITTETGYKLFVETGIRTRKVKVDVLNWADYVFHSNYRLRPLSEVEQYIKQHGHLPEVLSEEEVKNEGIDLADNQATLLKKVEELTLYLIEQNKKQENQQKLIEEQRLLLQSQQQRLDELEKKLKEKH